MKIKELETTVQANTGKLAELRQALATLEANKPAIGYLSAKWDDWKSLHDRLQGAIDELSAETEPLTAALERTNQAQEIARKMGVTLEDALIDEPTDPAQTADLRARMIAGLGWNLSPEAKAAIEKEYQERGQ